MNVSRAVADLENCTWGRTDLFKHLFFPLKPIKPSWFCSVLVMKILIVSCDVNVKVLCTAVFTINTESRQHRLSPLIAFKQHPAEVHLLLKIKDLRAATLLSGP